MELFRGADALYLKVCMWKSLGNFRPDKIERLLTSMTIVSTHSVALEIGHSKATNVANSMFLLSLTQIDWMS